MLLSDLTQQFDLPPNRLYQLKDEFLRAGKPLTDLVSGNVNQQGIHFPASILQQALRKGLMASRDYHPDSFGQPAARKAIRRLYAGSNLVVPEDQILLTPGTSISYWYAFKTLANPGDEILSPCPSYPLFEAIAGLSGVILKPYRLQEGNRWSIDFDHLESQITSRTKAIILISPHNPTGSVASEKDIQTLAALAAKYHLAVISDEVFSPFLYTLKRLPRPVASLAPLVFTLNGISKMLALPGMKIGWMAVTGDSALVKASLKSLAMISDTFLPVNEAAQFALPDLLKKSALFQKTYIEEMNNRSGVAADVLGDRLKGTFARPEGGFFMTLNLQGTGMEEDDLAYRLLKKHRILVHPGYFYDMEGNHLVFSFASQPSVLRRALKILLSEIL